MLRLLPMPPVMFMVPPRPSNRAFRRHVCILLALLLFWSDIAAWLLS